MQRVLITALSAVALALAGCGGNDDSTSGIDGITVSKAANPKVTVAKDFSAKSTEIKVIEDGGGETIADGDTVKINYVLINGRTGKQFDSSYVAERPATLTVSSTSNILPGLVKALDGQKVGSRLLTTIAPKDGFGADRTELELLKSDTIVLVVDIVAKVPSAASGDAEKLPDDLPKLTLDGDERPVKFEATDDTADTQTEASSHVVIEGTGKPVELNQTITIQYVGQLYPAGKVFDSSWARNSASSFLLAKGELIDCWTDELPGVKVGSRVVLVCPSDVAYGDEGRAPDIEGGDTLIFSIDVLDAS